jgi:methionine-rich copper-binding protein CopC
VPLLLGESENRRQGSSDSVTFIKSYNARAHSGVATTAQSSNIVLTMSPADQTIRFSEIVITNTSVNVTAAHIHGPCADATPCSDGGVVYTICSPCPATMSGTITIPNFIVDIAQLNGNFSTAIGLYQGIMYSNRLYYLNFHTQR